MDIRKNIVTISSFKPAVTVGLNPSPEAFSEGQGILVSTRGESYIIGSLNSLCISNTVPYSNFSAKIFMSFDEYNYQNGYSDRRERQALKANDNNDGIYINYDISPLLANFSMGAVVFSILDYQDSTENSENPYKKITHGFRMSQKAIFIGTPVKHSLLTSAGHLFTDDSVVSSLDYKRIDHINRGTLLAAHVSNCTKGSVITDEVDNLVGFLTGKDDSPSVGLFCSSSFISNLIENTKIYKRGNYYNDQLDIAYVPIPSLGIQTFLYNSIKFYYNKTKPYRGQGIIVNTLFPGSPIPDTGYIIGVDVLTKINRESINTPESRSINHIIGSKSIGSEFVIQQYSYTSNRLETALVCSEDASQVEIESIISKNLL